LGSLSEARASLGSQRSERVQGKPFEFLSFRSSLGKENLIIKISKVLVFERHIFYTFVGPLFVDNAIDS